ncbi:phosphotransferase family protein [Haliscomenobacter hydrossis]|uniref:Aminoglycoside phosphotransferase n=1 Tax=Haliscomenobacter hydrossis (strain ATCC 27775 / DSM 1100 / LMG 10767 / O) TaxID=760192 RepID=F4KSQ0_HALH1|nr:phosphotransferase family protein [Haliscomenobacter hydrossis]AEE48014.1 aminoglycoside phosphotransferase [Haliscomenobacter hydrossis DSM 1100]
MTNIRLDAATEPRVGEELPLEKLNDYLHAAIPGFGNIIKVGQFGGGYSNLTYQLQTADQTYVLRRPPFGAKDIKKGHNMAREYQILSTLHQAGYNKVPQVLLCCEDESLLGFPFYLMEKIEGVILRGKMAHKIQIPAEQMRQLSISLIDALVELHQIDIEQTGLIQLGKPEGYIRRQVEGWSQRYAAAQTDEIPQMEELSSWLIANLPAEGKPSFIHNDFKYDNAILHPESLEISAILDWEMSTVGDPMMDFGTSLSYWCEAGDGDFEKSFNVSWLPGNLTRQEVAEYYSEKSGRDTSNALYFYVFGLFKNAVIMQQIYSRYKKGYTQDERFAMLIWGVQVLAKKAIQALEEDKI